MRQAISANGCPNSPSLSDSAIHDPEAAGKFVKGYPKKVIGHKEARERALAAHANNKSVKQETG